MSVKIQKIVARLHVKIKEGQSYEAQQQARVVASRYIKSKDWNSAIDILFNVAESLLKAGQGASGGDLSLMLVDVYQQAELKPDPSNKDRLLKLLRGFDSDEPTRKRFIGEFIGWSARHGQYPAGEPDLHHVAGSIYAEEHDVYEAERHLTLGTKDSPEILASLEFVWYNQDDSHTAAIYAARAVFPYLLAGNLRDANKSMQVFLEKLTTRNDTILVQHVSGNTAEISVYPSLPLLNFLGLLLIAIQKGIPETFKQLYARYASHIKEIGVWEETLALIGELYFGVVAPRPSNPLFDMMGSMFGGAVSAKPKLKRIGPRETVDSPIPEGLD